MREGIVSQAAGHLLVASIITVPASIMIARIMIPQTEAPTPGHLALHDDTHGPIDALM
jgi:CNT family concentrative nucleoside transporter